jgi:hypothetical protein
MVINNFNDCARGCSLDIAPQINITGEPESRRLELEFHRAQNSKL